MKGFLLTSIALLVPLAGLGYWAYRPRLAAVRSRIGRAMKVTAVLYLGIILYRLAASNMDEVQLETVALVFIFFGGLWLAAWIVTRALAR